jgi:hypothetical protein
MTSGCYVYAILPREIDLPAGLAGFNGAPLTPVAYRDLAAMTSQVDSQDIRPLPDQVLHHESIVEALRQLGRALPVRFGTVLADSDAVAGAIAERYQTLIHDLARIGDKVEFGVTVLWDEPAANDEQPAAQAHHPLASQGTGASYLRARMNEFRRDQLQRERAKAIQQEVDAALGVHAIEQRATVLPTPRIAVRAAYLLHPSSEAGLDAAFDQLRRERPDLHFLLTGPWPPYTFVTSPDQGKDSGDLLRWAASGTGHA